MLRTLGLAALAAVLFTAAVPADDKLAVVSHVNVVSDKVEDVSSLDAWKSSFIKPGMTDEQKAKAIWETVVKFRHQDIPPNEFVESESHVHDPIKQFNVYGYGQCCCASAAVEALARYAGMKSRGWGIVAHSVPEVYYNDSWHMIDGSLMTYFPKPDGQLAGVEDITASIADWYAKHPEYKGNDKKLRDYMRNDGWKNGPEMLRSCPFYDDNGWFMAATHGWYSTMGEYGNKSKTFVYEYGSPLGYEVNVQLRPGMRLVRNWSNKGLHVNALEGGRVGCIDKSTGQEDLRYSPRFGDLAPGRVGNGTLEYDVPLASPGLADAALEYGNLSAGLRAADPSKPAILTLRMPTSYIYLSGDASYAATIGNGGAITVAFSDNNGLDWKDVAHLTSGQGHVNLKPLVYRRYDYRLRFTLTGQGTSLSALKLIHDIQHSQRVLPALDKGTNTITFSAGPQEGTITVEGATNPKNKSKNLTLADFHPDTHNLKDTPALFLTGPKGDITFPITAPGDITRIRCGLHYRARGAADGWDLQASFDSGKSFKTFHHFAGPYGGNSEYVTLSEIPPGARSVLVRLAGTQRNTTGILDLRIDADYLEPHGGFAPVKITYVYNEGATEKRNTHTTTHQNDTYTINCADKPALKSITLELAE